MTDGASCVGKMSAGTECPVCLFLLRRSVVSSSSEPVPCSFLFTAICLQRLLGNVETLLEAKAVAFVAKQGGL